MKLCCKIYSAIVLILCFVNFQSIQAQRTDVEGSADALADKNYVLKMSKIFRKMANSFGRKLKSLSTNQQALKQSVITELKLQSQMKRKLDEISGNSGGIRESLNQEIYHLNGSSQIVEEVMVDDFQDLADAMIRYPGIEYEPYEQGEIPVTINVENFSGGIGNISFSGRTNDTWKRKFWILEKTGVVQLTMTENKLLPGTHLTFTGIARRGEQTECCMNSTTTSRNTCVVSGAFVLVTLSVSTTNTADLDSSFKIRFSNTRNNTVVPPELIIYNANIITQNRAQQISFPLNNTNQYVNYVVHLTLIAPVSRNPFRLSVTFLDAEPSCNGCDVLKIFSIAEDPNRQRALISQIGTNYTQTTPSSTFVGSTSAAILLFSADSSNTGMGYKVRLEPVN